MDMLTFLAIYAATISQAVGLEDGTLNKWGPTTVSGALLLLFGWFIRHLVTVTLPSIQKEFNAESQAHREANARSRELFMEEARAQRESLGEAIREFRQELQQSRTEYREQLESDRRHHIEIFERFYTANKEPKK